MMDFHEVRYSSQKKLSNMLVFVEKSMQIQPNFTYEHYGTPALLPHTYRPKEIESGTR